MRSKQERDILARRRRDKIAEWGSPGMQRDLNELEDRVETAESERDVMQSALLRVKYWLHDIYYLRRPVSNPRDVLRQVERALE